MNYKLCQIYETRYRMSTRIFELVDRRPKDRVVYVTKNISFESSMNVFFSYVRKVDLKELVLWNGWQ